MPKRSPRLLIVIGIAIGAGNAAVQYTARQLILSVPSPDFPLFLAVNLIGSFVFVFDLVVFILGAYRYRRRRRSDLTIDIL